MSRFYPLFLFSEFFLAGGADHGLHHPAYAEAHKTCEYRQQLTNETRLNTLAD